MKTVSSVWDENWMNFDNSILKLCIYTQNYDIKKVCLVIYVT